MAHHSGFITPAKVNFFHSIELVTMVVFGGLASTFGAVIGAASATFPLRESRIQRTADVR
jgi:branched-chain amino acid transport system permease protein